MPEGPPGRCSRPRPRSCPPFWDDLVALGWLGLHLPEARGRLGLRAARARRRGRGARSRPGAGAVRADRDRQRRARRRCAGRAAPNGSLPGLADGSVFGGVALASDITVSGGTAAGTAPAVLGGGLAQVLVLPAGDDAIVVDDVGERRQRSRCRPTSTRRGAARASRSTARPRGDPRRPRGCSSTWPVLIAAAEAVRHRHRVHGAGGGVRQGAGAVRSAHRHLPGRQAPLRQHARGVRAGHRRRVGRGAGGRGGRRPALLRRGDGGRARPRRRRRVRPAQHPGARRHRLHLGARRPPLPPPGHRARSRRRRARRRRATSTDLVRAGARRVRTIDLPPEAEPMRDEVRALRRAGQGARRGGAARRR